MDTAWKTTGTLAGAMAAEMEAARLREVAGRIAWQARYTAEQYRRAGYAGTDAENAGRQFAGELDEIATMLENGAGVKPSGPPLYRASAVDAGLRTDALVARLVFGFEPTPAPDVAFDEEGMRSVIPHYSTRVEDAWEIVRLLRIHGVDVRIDIRNDRTDVTLLSRRVSIVETRTYDGSLPLAICRAVLGAVEDKSLPIPVPVAAARPWKS